MTDSMVDVKPVLPPPEYYRNTAGVDPLRIKSEPDSPDATKDPKPPSHCTLATKQEEAGFPCFMCSAHFPSKAHLDAHLLIHPSENPYSCDVCGEGFAQESEMLRHRIQHDRKVSQVKKPKPKEMLPCNMCSRKFVGQFYLCRHKRLVHNVVDEGKMKKCFKCEFCGKNYKNSGNLLIHLKKTHHTTDFYTTPLQDEVSECPVCNKRVLKVYWRHHVAEHDTTCMLCGKRFPTKRDVREHEKTCEVDSESDD